MQKFAKASNDRANAKAKQLARAQTVDGDDNDEVELTSVVQQENAVNQNVVDGKQQFGFEVGDVLKVKYIEKKPPKGLEWMKDGDFVALVLK